VRLEEWIFISQLSTLNSQLAPTLNSQLVGRTRCDRLVVFDGNPRLAGTATHVAIYDASPTTLMGMIVTRELQHSGANALPILA
jgi:tRNA-2-methylthio-N6-dimethylallyladenosine synthase